MPNATHPGQGRAAMQAGGFLPGAFSGYASILPEQIIRAAKDFFVYVAQFISLGASATATVNTAIQNDSDFLIVAGVRNVTATDNTTFITAIPELVTISSDGSGRNFQNAAVHMDNLFGTAQLPCYWPYPKLVGRGSTLATTVENLEATARHVRLAYLGFKIFNYPQDQVYDDAEF